VRPEQAVGLLAQSPLFASLDSLALSALAAEGHEKSFARHTSIFQEGDPGDAFYVIANGAVKIYVTSPHGDEMVLTTLHPPATLGEVALFDAGPRSASAQALDRVRLLTFAGSTILGLAERDSRIYASLLRGAGALLRRLTAQAADFVFLDLEGRVAKLLSEAADTRGVREGERVVLDLGLTQGELASMVGGSRQSVNMILHSLQGRGLIEVDRENITVDDLSALHRRASI
jgi:CRP/FNR family transcriptional regulator, cyclic AMP receptor protein